jgi:hypothetical protein
MAMSGMNQATHDYIVFKLGQAVQILLLAQRDTPVRKNYKNFEMAIAIVRGVQKAFGDTWEATRDANTAMPELESARAKLTLVHAGEAAPSVAAATKHIDEIINALKPHLDAPTS